jgi:hypothetical protein
MQSGRAMGAIYHNYVIFQDASPLYFLSSNSKCNTTGSDGLRCCHAKKMLHALEC